MSRILFVLFLFSGLFAQAQNDLYVVNKRKESEKWRVSKGSFLYVKTMDGKTHSGTLVKVKEYSIVLMRYDSTIDIDNISWLKVKNGQANLFLAGPFIVYSYSRNPKFDVRYWEFSIQGK